MAESSVALPHLFTCPSYAHVFLQLDAVCMQEAGCLFRSPGCIPRRQLKAYLLLSSLETLCNVIDEKPFPCSLLQCPAPLRCMWRAFSKENAFLHAIKWSVPARNKASHWCGWVENGLAHLCQSGGRRRFAKCMLHALGYLPFSARLSPPCMDTCWSCRMRDSYFVMGHMDSKFEISWRWENGNSVKI